MHDRSTRLSHTARALSAAATALITTTWLTACRADPTRPPANAPTSAPTAERAAALKATLTLPPLERDAALKRLLSTIEYEVTQRAGTERAFTGRDWDNHAPGIYVDLISGEPLFSSAHKFDSGTGWPSFDRPLDPSHLLEVEDRSLGEVRVEVRATASGAHLGHVFEDGPRATTGRRFCMNSAALRFIPLEALEREGYGEWIERAGLTPSAPGVGEGQ
jgi:methionine-R-sulfoxide reductase